MRKRSNMDTPHTRYVTSTRRHLDILVTIMQLCGICCVTKDTKISRKIASVTIYIFYMMFIGVLTIYSIITVARLDTGLDLVYYGLMFTMSSGVFAALSLASWNLRKVEKFYGCWMKTNVIMSRKEAMRSTRNMKVAVYLGVCVLSLLMIVMLCFSIIHVMSLDDSVIKAYVPVIPDACVESIKCRALVFVVWTIVDSIPGFATLLMWYYFMLVTHVIKKELKRFNDHLEMVDSSKVPAKLENDTKNVILAAGGNHVTIEEYRLQHDVICQMIKAGSDVFCMQLGLILALGILTICLSLLCLAQTNDGNASESVYNSISTYNIVNYCVLITLFVTQCVSINDLVSNTHISSFSAGFISG